MGKKERKIWAMPALPSGRAPALCSLLLHQESLCRQDCTEERLAGQASYCPKPRPLLPCALRQVPSPTWPSDPIGKVRELDSVSRVPACLCPGNAGPSWSAGPASAHN